MSTPSNGAHANTTRWLFAMLIASGVAVGCSTDETPQPGATRASAAVTGGDFHSLVADPTDPARLYAGGHAHVARSEDGGTSWQTVEVLDDVDAMGWSITDGAIWVSGHPGLTVSRDGGSTFDQANDGLDDTDVHAFGAVGTQLYAAGPGIGVAASADGGATWTTMTRASGQAFFGRMLIDPADTAHVVAADGRAGVVESRNGGRTWTALGTDPATWVSSPDGLATIYASGGPSAQQTADGGASWSPVALPAGATLLEAASDGRLYAGVHDGNAVTVWSSSDNGGTWLRP